MIKFHKIKEKYPSYTYKRIHTNNDRQKRRIQFLFVNDITEILNIFKSFSHVLVKNCNKITRNINCPVHLSSEEITPQLTNSSIKLSIFNK